MKKWVVLILVLALGVAWMWLRPLQRPEVPRLSPVQPEIKGIDNLLAALDPRQQLEGKDDYFSIVQRPVFFHLRRPPDVYVPPVPKKKSKPTLRKSKKKPNFKLTGVIIIGKERFALIKGGKKGRSHRLRQGEKIDDWQVIKIEKEKVTLSSGSDSLELALRTYEPVLPAAASPAANNRGRTGRTAKAGKPNARLKARQGQPVSSQTWSVDNSTASSLIDREKKMKASARRGRMQGRWGSMPPIQR